MFRVVLLLVGGYVLMNSLPMAHSYSHATPIILGGLLFVLAMTVVLLNPRVNI